MLKSSRWRALLTLNLILAGTVIAVASLYPRLQLPGVGEGFDLGFHGAAYGGLLILGGMLRYRLSWVVGAVLLYSTLLEGLQNFVPGREFFLSDLAANVVGILAGLAILALWHRLKAVREPDDRVL